MSRSKLDEDDKSASAMSAGNPERDRLILSGEMARDSVMYLRAAKLLLAQGPVTDANWPTLWKPIHFLLCHAMELSLKAWLQYHGVERRGHNLSKLLIECSRHGVQLSENFKHACGMMHFNHLQHDFRYVQMKGFATMWPGTLLECIEPQISESCDALIAELTKRGLEVNLDEAILLADEATPALKKSESR